MSLGNPKQQPRRVSNLSGPPQISPGRTAPPRLRPVPVEETCERSYLDGLEEFESSHLSVVLKEVEQSQGQKEKELPRPGQKVYRERKRRAVDSSEDSRGSAEQLKYAPLKFVESEEGREELKARQAKQALVDQKKQVLSLKQKIGAMMSKGIDNLSSEEKRYLKLIRRNIEEGRFEDE